ncbi:Eco57I restriction-modification methylase [Thermodesulfobium acidiphilum]|uniref:site-specific DNA-methyltransferase (adenine-specific) n=1 Tax=Thermodesulfobium acidiphilum TaxID=1794699 RepID=A0A2R4W1W7_THEAF|nr:TaqI-like C-terminal specificity domain-containing protein [Thermodesulfobium acidiphilum]AWB10775.1 Eco57I restriction-modification methylase [Thermodesulfobium acidiphilum]
MNENLFKNLIKDIFEKSFDKVQFTKFLRNLLNDFEKDTFKYVGNYIPDSFEQYIKSFERIGKYKDNKKEIDLLVVHLKSETSLLRARTAQRNFIGWFLNGSRGGKLKDAALVAFVSPDQENWRFSLVKMEYRFDENGKVIEELSPARRYSFLVGKNESSHTAQSRFLPLLSPDKKPTLDDLEKAFSAERVTDEFFEKYKELFIKTVDEIEERVKTNESLRKEFEIKNINAVDFSKKLLGQIVFLYFLQKKGWLGVPKAKNWGEGDKNFLRSLFERCIEEKKNFFNDYLEYLFYDALNNERSSQADPSWHERLDCKIPFLNGGLFEPFGEYDWKNIDLLIPDDLFSNNAKEGILDIFDLFNFTVKEDEPLEKEVAVDPELLGKIYEKLNAIREDNFEEYKKALKSKGSENKFNKEYGVYYTPREIVHFMAQNALVEYLFENLKGKSQNLESLKEDLKAFIFHSEKFIENDKTAIEKGEKIEKGEQKSTKYTSKIPAFIQENAKTIDKLLEDIRILDPAVGSGAFPIGLMHEIVKAREVLNLYIGDETKTAYNFKRHSIQNSLYGVDIDKGAVEITRLRFWLSLVVDEEDLTQIKPLPNLDYKLVSGDSLSCIQKDLFKSFDTLEQLEDEYHTTTNLDRKRKLKRKIDEEIKELTDGHTEFDFEVYFSKVMRSGGFDIVIGNPPYIQLQKNAGLLAKKYKKFNYEVFNSMGDIYTLFYEKGINLLKEGGHLCFITSNKWMRAGYGEKLREFFIKQNPKILIDLGPGVFESATVDTNILLIQKKDNQNKLTATTLQKEDKKNILNAIDKKGILLEKLSKDAWFIGSSAEQRLKEKIERLGKPLKEWDVNIYRGIITGLNEAFIITTEKKDEILTNCKTEEERERTNKIIKPILRGRDIKRYYYEWAGLWVIVIPAGWTNNNKGNENAQSFIEKTFPSLMQHLKSFEAKAKKRDDKGDYWWELRHCAYYPEFEKEKVVWAEIVRQPQFYFDNEKFYVEATSFLMTGNNVKYICGLLNSGPVTYFFKNWYAGGGLGKEGYRYKKAFLENLPIPFITSSNSLLTKRIEDLLDKILVAKKENPQANTQAFEKEIDELVYKLYDLTEDEIRIIEGGR